MKDRDYSEKLLGQTIRELRKAKKIGLNEMARDLDVASSYISEVERGNKHCSDDLLAKIADYLEVSQDYLFRFGDRVPKYVLDSVKKDPVIQKLVKEASTFLNEDDMEDLFKLICKIKKRKGYF